MCLLLAGTTALRADSTSTNEFIPDLPSLWMHEVQLRASVGYKDNLTLSPAAQEQSVALGSGLDVTLARLPLDGRQVTFLLSADDVRYPDGKDVRHEDLLVALAQFKVDTSPHWRLGLDARYVFQDQVVDTSVTETNLSATLVRGNGVALLPNARWAFYRDTWLEFSGMLQRQWYREPLDDYLEGGPRLTLGHDYGRRSALTLAYGYNFRGYDTREQVSLIGTNLPGTSLDFQQHEVEAAWRHAWDERRRWRTTTRLGFQANLDNGPGYYDYQRYTASQQVRYVAAPWEFKVQARISYYDFQEQEVSASDPELRRKATVSAQVRADRRLGRHWSLFAEYEYEQSLSNRDLDQYQVNRVAGGVNVEF